MLYLKSVTRSGEQEYCRPKRPIYLMARKTAVQMRIGDRYIINQFINGTQHCNFLFSFMRDEIHRKKVNSFRIKMQQKETILSSRVNPLVFPKKGQLTPMRDLV